MVAVGHILFIFILPLTEFFGVLAKMCASNLITKDVHIKPSHLIFNFYPKRSIIYFVVLYTNC